MLASGAVNPWTVLLTAVGLAVFLEGLPYFVSPNGVRRAMAQLASMSDRTLRTVGLALMLVGLALTYVSLH